MLVVMAVLAFALTTLFGCGSKTSSDDANSNSTIPMKDMSYHMSGEPVSVYVSQEVVDQRKPLPWDLGTPESAVKSYLEWVSYAFRIGDSQVATPTMSAYEEVRVDSYCQYNIQNKRLLDQTLDSLTFGKPSTTATCTVVPATESWTYSYLSVEQGNAVIGGPYTLKYNSTYRVIKNDAGNWVVDSVEAKPEGTVK